MTDVQPNALYVQANYAVDEKSREIFFFSDGSAVFWGMPESEVCLDFTFFVAFPFFVISELGVYKDFSLPHILASRIRF